MLGLLVLLAVSRPLSEAVVSGDSATRERAAYVLARSYEFDDSGASEMLRRIAVSGSGPEHAAMIRGLAARNSPLSDDAKKTIVTALTDRQQEVRDAALEALVWLPRGEAVDDALHELPLALRQPNGSTGAGGAEKLRDDLVATVVRLGDAKAKDAVTSHLRLHRIGGAAVAFDSCALDECLDDFAAFAWLGEKLDRLDKRIGQNIFDSDSTRLSIWRVHAAAGDGTAIHALANAATTWVDPALRRRALEFLLQTPPATRSEAVEVLLHSASDPDGRVRFRATSFLSAGITRLGVQARITELLRTALTDANTDVRLEAAAGLWEVNTAAAERKKAAEGEADLAVKAFLIEPRSR